MPHRPLRRWCLLVLLAICGAGTGVARPRPSLPALRLRWEVTAVSPSPRTGKPITHARLVLENAGKQPLPAGWILWFTAMSDPATADPVLPLRRVAGSLFAFDGGQPLAPGASIALPFDSPGITRDSKGPTGPYLTLAADPGHGIAITSFSRRGPRHDTPGIPATLYADRTTAFFENLAWPGVDPASVPPLLPTPKHWHIASTPAFPAQLAPPRLSPGLAVEAPQARRLAHAPHGLPFVVETGPVPGETSPEAFRLAITRREARLTGASAAGVAYGLGAVGQLLARAHRQGGRWREMEISDAPRFAHRGLLIDIARNYQGPAELRRVIDLMALLRLNRLHLHLADDEGWRLAIPALPELTSIGARRGHSAQQRDRLPPAYGSGPDVNDPHGSGFLTGKDYVALLRHAAARHIEVIPEIDMPGHARAAIQAMVARDAAHPEERGSFRLTDPADTSHYLSAQGYADNAIDPALPSALTFVTAVTDELVRLHARAGEPLRRMHIGGDEVARGAWTGSPAFRAWSVAHGLNPADPATPGVLWRDYFGKVEAMLAARGIAASGWEELGMNPASGAVEAPARPGISVQVWNNGDPALGARLLAAGYDLVASPAGSLYLDLAQSSDPEDPGHDWAGTPGLAQVFAYDPETVPLAAPGHLLGIEAALFSETVRGPRTLDRMLLPRLLAVAERAWGPRPPSVREGDPARAHALRLAEWGIFSHQAGEIGLPMVARAGWRYHVPAPGVSGNRINTSWPGLRLRHTVHAATAISPEGVASLPSALAR